MHCHSTNSDGAQSPLEVYTHARDKWINIHAITDHDTITWHPDFPAWVQQDGRLILEWVEVSARYERDGYKKSLHIPVYALSLSGELEDILTGIRRWKAEKVQRQCEQLRQNWCLIELPDKSIVPFSWDAMRICFPDTREEGFNNWHLAELLLRYRKNLRTLEHIAPWINKENLIREGFKSEGRYTKVISLRERPKEYEPTIEEVISAINPSNTIISIAHPNYTFRSVEEFREQVGYIMSLGVNAIELNSTASPEWVNAIHDFRDFQMESYSNPALMTLGSDCHDLSPTRPDKRHSLIWDMNPLLTSIQAISAAISIRSQVFTHY